MVCSRFKDAMESRRLALRQLGGTTADTVKTVRRRQCLSGRSTTTNALTPISTPSAEMEPSFNSGTAMGRTNRSGTVAVDRSRAATTEGAWTPISIQFGGTAPKSSYGTATTKSTAMVVRMNRDQWNAMSKRNQRLRIIAAALFVPAIAILFCDLLEYGVVPIWVGLFLLMTSSVLIMISAVSSQKK